MKVPKQQWRKNWKTQENTSMAAGESQKQKKRWSLKFGMMVEKFILHREWTSVISRIRSWSHSFKSTRVELYSEVILWEMIQDRMLYSQSKIHLRHKRRQQKSWISYPGCQDAKDKQQTQYQLHPGRNGTCTNVTENSKVGMSRHLDSSTTTQLAEIMVQYGRSSRSSWTESVRSSIGRTIMGKAIWENLAATRLGKSSQNGNVYSLTEKKDYSCLCMWTTKKLAGKKQISNRLGKFSWKTLNWENQHHFLTKFIWVALKEKVRSARKVWIITEVWSNEGFLSGIQKNYRPELQGKLMQKQYLFMRRNVCKGIANLQIKQPRNFSESQRHA